MQTHIAKMIRDVQDVSELMEDETWKHARTFLKRAQQDPFADHLRWIEDGGRPVACVQVFLHNYEIGEARLGMCLPEYPFVPPPLRGRGFFKELMSGLFVWMRANGYPLAYDHGRKGLYTSIGFAPCFHHCVVLLRLSDAEKVRSEEKASVPSSGDIGALARVFRRPNPLGRGLQCRDERWLPDPDTVRLSREPATGVVNGFVVLGEVVRRRFPDGTRDAGFGRNGGSGALVVTDGWARNTDVAASLLHAVAGEARVAGWEWIKINCRRNDPIANLAVLAGGELRWCAAQERDYTQDGEDVDAFYLADLRLAIQQLLPELDARWQAFSGYAPPAIRVIVENEEVVLGLSKNVVVLDAAPGAPHLVLSRKAMTRAIMGYATPTELSYVDAGCVVPAECRELSDVLLGAREPHLIHENWAFAEIEELGLVP